jgi:AbrB family transcriptional regulator (stage V sporulation protein T)
MKATGIVRRIDELGRVVIPKEIRRTLRIREGDPLELFTDRDEVMLKKYSPIASIDKFSSGTAKSLSEQSGFLAVICDTDGVLHAFGQGKKAIINKSVSEELIELMRSRRSYLANLAEGGDILPVATDSELSVTAEVIVPIVSGGDCLGAVALLSEEEGAKMENTSLKLARLTADILAGQFEG